MLEDFQDQVFISEQKWTSPPSYGEGACNRTVWEMCWNVVFIRLCLSTGLCTRPIGGNGWTWNCAHTGLRPWTQPLSLWCFGPVCCFPTQGGMPPCQAVCCFPTQGLKLPRNPLGAIPRGRNSTGTGGMCWDVVFIRLRLSVGLCTHGQSEGNV